MKYLLLVVFLYTYCSKAFTQSSLKPDTLRVYKVGYKNIITVDSNRIYKRSTDSGSKLHFRPIEIDFWYPISKSKSISPILYGYFLSLLQQRSNRFQDDTFYSRITSELVDYLSINLKISDTSRLTQLQTVSYSNEIPFPQRFPLILYLCSYNGISYENVDLFEWLAAHGYLVACITSVGRYPGNMSTQMPDLMEQVTDGAFAISYLRMEQNADTSRIGVMGYSWGGLAALVLAMNNTEVKCLLSLDGSEMHYYGDSKEEDHDFDQIRNSANCQVKKLNIPYAYLESGFKQSERDADSIFNMFTLSGAHNLYVHFPKAIHEDFSCLPSRGSPLYGTKTSGTNLYTAFKQLVLYYFDQHLKSQKNELPSFLNTIFRSGTGDSIYPLVKNIKDLIGIKGRIIDDKDKEVLAFVNVGIRNKNIGTVSAPDGNFQVKVYPELKADSLTFSMAGYQTMVISISDLLRSSKPITVSLKENITELKEVIVTSKAMKTVTKGNTTTSNFISIGLPLKFLGSETGIRLHLGKKQVLLKSFSFNISDNQLDTAVFRLNIYSIKNGTPFKNILHQNILVPVGKQTGKYTLNLNDYELVFQGDVFLSLEWIEGSSNRSGNGAIFLSAGLLNSTTWHRLTSQAQWKKATGLGVGFNVLIQPLKN
ncbi:MAG: carboxypeptidase-like regulatory domain-containing protein [Ferruginibacter sp.]